MSRGKGTLNDRPLLALGGLAEPRNSHRDTDANQDKPELEVPINIADSASHDDLGQTYGTRRE